jgi:hypothetical protein
LHGLSHIWNVDLKKHECKRRIVGGTGERGMVKGEGVREMNMIEGLYMHV